MTQVFAYVDRIRRRISPREGDFKEFYINRALVGRASSIYVEIGVRRGHSFRKVRADRKIGIDPVRTPEMVTLLKGEEFHELPSDVFFEQQARICLKLGSVDVALIDGLHEYRQVLADFCNIEPYMKPDGVVFFDDCNPISRKRAEVRDGGAWNGDVWRVIALLKAHRSDLRVIVIDCDQGLGMVTHFGEASKIDDKTVASFASLDYSVLASDRERCIGLLSRRLALEHVDRRGHR